jgi:hypothetical protein
MMTLTPPPHIQAAIAAACAAEDERRMQSPEETTRGTTHTQAGDCSYKHAYQLALALAQRIGLTVPFQYNGMECFAAPGDQWRRA